MQDTGLTQVAALKKGAVGTGGAPPAASASAWVCAACMYAVPAACARIAISTASEITSCTIQRAGWLPVGFAAAAPRAPPSSPGAAHIATCPAALASPAPPSTATRPGCSAGSSHGSKRGPQTRRRRGGRPGARRAAASGCRGGRLGCRAVGHPVQLGGRLLRPVSRCGGAPAVHLGFMQGPLACIKLIWAVVPPHGRRPRRAPAVQARAHTAPSMRARWSKQAAVCVWRCSCSQAAVPRTRRRACPPRTASAPQAVRGSPAAGSPGRPRPEQPGPRQQPMARPATPAP